MDWQMIKERICEGRKFTLTGQGCRVLSDTIMPSGGAVYIHMLSRQGSLFVHDGGAAVDELARHGVDVSSTVGVRKMLKQTKFGLSNEGQVFRERVDLDQAAVGIALVADASLRAATYMLARATGAQVRPLDRQVKDALRVRYPTGRPDYSFNGKNRQHTFDFGVTVEGETFLVQAVSPDRASISAAIVKAIDAREAPGGNVHPIFVFDPHAEWKAGDLNMLEFGGVSMEVGRIEREALPLAA